MKSIKIPEKNIRVTQVEQKGKSWNEIKIPKGWKICTYPLLQWLRNNDKYRDKLGLMNNTGEWCINPDKLMKKKGYVARFRAYSDWVYLDCYLNPQDAYPGLGVRFCRDLKKVNKNEM